MSALTITRPSEDLAGKLSHLENASLIRLAAAQPELAYIFRHALVQDSAYQSLVRADRRRVHLAAGQALEALFSSADQPLEVLLPLARHFEEAAQHARAIHYYTLAGDASLAVYANVEAVAAYSRALACAERTTTTAAAWQHLFAGRGRALELNSQFAEALANYETMAQQAEALGHRGLALTAAVAIGQLYATPTPLFNPLQAENSAQSALAEARALGDEAAEAKILWNQMNLYRNTQRSPQARLYGERSLEIAQRLGLTEQAALTLNDLVHVYADLALWPQARQAAADVGRLWRALGNTAMLADSLSTAALNNSLLGEFATALSQAQEAQRLSVAVGNLWGQAYGLSGMSWPYWFMGQPDRALEANEACIRLGRLAGYVGVEILDQARLAYMFGELGQTERALELLQRAEGSAKFFSWFGLGTILPVRIHLELRSAQVEQAAATLQEIEAAVQTPMIWEVDAVLRARSEVALAQNDALHALQTTEAHVARLTESGLTAFMPEALVGLAQALARLGRIPEARHNLHEARDLVQHLGAPALEWLILSALGSFEAEHGHPAAASEPWARAREIVSAFAARVPTPELRASFLARPDVRALLSQPAPPAAATSRSAPAQPAP
jgi:tetratricopeptide (TPR) repeat protein